MVGCCWRHRGTGRKAKIEKEKNSHNDVQDPYMGILAIVDRNRRLYAQTLPDTKEDAAKAPKNALSLQRKSGTLTGEACFSCLPAEWPATI